MGGNCCAAARNKPSPHRISCDVSNYRNVRDSPSWSFRWDNRTHIEDVMDNPSRFSHQSSVNVSSEIKSVANTETEGLSDGGSSLDAFHIPKWCKSPSKVGIAGSSKSVAADRSICSNSPPEEKGYVESSVAASASDTKPSISIPSTPSSSSFKAAGPSTSRSCSLPCDTTSSRKAGRSPGYQLSRQVSDSRIPSLKSLNESGSCSPEGRQSFVLSVCSNNMSAGGSHGGSSDGWSMRTFSELVAASTQRDRSRWSFDSENLSSINSKFPRSSPPSAYLQSCRACSKLLREKSPWSVQKIISANEISVAAVLICGHVYHAECLESITPEPDRYDPPCPVCTNGENSALKFGKAELKARSKISRRAVADVEGASVSGHCKSAGKSPRMGASSSMKASFGAPFLRRHFSIGPRPPTTRSVSENEATRKRKGFWARYRRD